MGKAIQTAHQRRTREQPAERPSGVKADNRQGDSQGYRQVATQRLGDGSDRHKYGPAEPVEGGAFPCRIVGPTPKQIWTPSLVGVLCPQRE